MWVGQNVGVNSNTPRFNTFGVTVITVDWPLVWSYVSDPGFLAGAYVGGFLVNFVMIARRVRRKESAMDAFAQGLIGGSFWPLVSLYLLATLGLND